MNSADDLPLCVACGMQYEEPRERCPICTDPRQYVPAPGQQWTTLGELRKSHRNHIEQAAGESHVWNIYTEPKFAIGQRAMLIETAAGLVLWDMIALIDEETEKFIKSKGNGKLAAIVISHPHFYTTNSVWAKVFDCPVYVAPEDLQWLFTRERLGDNLKLLEDVNTRIVDGVTAIKCGGHFEGSTCLHWENRLFHSDTVFAIASSRNPPGYRDESTHAYSFLWSIPNSIPLDPVTIHQIWTRLKPFDFDASFGNIPGLDARDVNLKKRLLASAKTQVTMMGWKGKPEGQLVLDEVLE